ncbi:MAG: phage tail assembly chaperone [Chthoniobacterales bacterium]
MKLYNFDAGTKIFTTEGIADESPLEPGVFLLPANATFIEPPNVKSNEVATWDGTQWSVQRLQDKDETKAEVPPLTWDIIEANRNILLSRCDWTQLPDVEIDSEEVAAWRVYRSKLREITSSFETPESVVWPTAP